MRSLLLFLCLALLSGCAVEHELAVANVAPRTKTPAPANSAIEVRHMYLFAPGKAPVKIVMRDDGTSTQDEAWNIPALEP